MRILHTADWHLGKTLEGFSRIEEQEKFIDDFIEIVNKKNIDMVIIAGDIYDSTNPSARAERLFYKALEAISDGGRRVVLAIAGNHDSPERLMASSPLTYDKAVILLGTPRTIVPKASGKEFEILDSGEGFVEIEIRGEKVVVATLAYPSEKRLNEVFMENKDEDYMKESYSKKVGELFSKLSKKFRDDTINIAVSHLFTVGGEITDSERPIEIGGSFAVDPKMLPQNAQYIALGHLHRPQKVKGTKLNAYYSGSPIPYSKSEINYSKCCYIVDVKPASEPKIETVLLKNYKPIEVWNCKSVDEAVEKCRENSKKSSWVYIKIKTDKYISQEKIKEMKELKDDIIQIMPDIDTDDSKIDFDSIKGKSMGELFTEFYKNERGTVPEDEVLDTFLNIVSSGEEK